MTQIVVPPRTVAEWQQTGYRGLRIPRCPTCQEGTWTRWEDLHAEPDEDVLDVANRVRCSGCGLPPAGLAVAAYYEEPGAASLRV